MLATLLGMVDRRARLVLVEDTAELMPDHPHVVKLEARRPNIEGQGAISMRELVKQALRMRPDRLVVGEARGGEVVDLLAALNTGHEGGAARSTRIRRTMYRPASRHSQPREDSTAKQRTVNLPRRWMP